MEKDILSIVDILNELFSGKWYRKITPDFFKEKVIENPYFSFNKTFVATTEKNIIGFAVHISKDKETMDFFLHQGYKIREGYYSEGIYVLSLKDYSIPEKILQREKDLESQGYKIKFVKDDKRISDFCRKNGKENWAISPPSLATVMEKDKGIVGFCGYTPKDEKRN